MLTFIYTKPPTADFLKTLPHVDTFENAGFRSLCVWGKTEMLTITIAWEFQGKWMKTLMK